MHGTPAASHASDTGLTVSGVEDVSIRSTFWPEIKLLACCAECCGSDWLSFVMILTSYFLPPTVSPSATAFCTRPTTYLSPSPKEAAGPVSGLTKPILIAPPLEPPDFLTPPHASRIQPEAKRRPSTPARTRKSRRGIPPSSPRSAISLPLRR